MTDVIKLNFINRSNDTNNSTVVIFQKNVGEDLGETAVAWQVIKNCGRLDNHPFSYPLQFEVSASDSYGNYSPAMLAYDGQAYQMVKDNSGDVLQISAEAAASQDEVEVRNDLAQGAIAAHAVRDGKICATVPGLAPGQKAVFKFTPRIRIGVMSQINEGDTLSAAILSQLQTELDLTGVTSADIVMTGGGPGAKADPFRFELENINT